MFDQDQAGISASVECANILPLRKVKIAKLQAKDASDLLQAGKANKIIDGVWEAKAYSPAGIIEVSETKDLLLKDDYVETYPYAWNGLNKSPAKGGVDIIEPYFNSLFVTCTASLISIILGTLSS